MGSMADLGMELQTVDGPAAVADGGHRTGIGGGQGDELIIDRGDLVAVAHPDLGLAGHADKQAVGVLNLAGGPAKLPAGRRQDLPSQGLAGQLHAVADAQDGNAQVEEGRIAARRRGNVDAGRAAGEDQAARLQLRDAGGRQVVAHDLAEDVQLAHPASDQLAVLRAEIQDQDSFTFSNGWHDNGPVPGWFHRAFWSAGL